VLIGTPLLGALVMMWFGARRWAPEANVVFSAVTLLGACALSARVDRRGQHDVSARAVLHRPVQYLSGDADRLRRADDGAVLAALHAHRNRAAAHREARLRLYHSMYQMFLATMLIALTTNNLGLLWVAMEAATLSTVLLVTFYQTRASIEAGWKYFILCGVGIAQALFGTILVYIAAEKVLGLAGRQRAAVDAPECRQRAARAARAQSRVRLPAGRIRHQGRIGAAAQLAAGRACGGSDADIRGAVRAAAERGDLRGRALQSAGRGIAASALAGPNADGIRDRLGGPRRVLPLAPARHQAAVRYSSIEHMGIITFAFGMGGPVANFAALLHMTVHSLTKSAIFFTVGHATQKSGSQLMDGIRGLVTISPAVGWGLMIGSLAILGMPPFGVFASEFLILTTAMREQPWATPLLLIALGVAFAAIFGRVQPMVFGETTAKRLPHPPALLPIFLHLALVLMLGLFIPPYLAEWYRAAARLIGGG
jgi:hydrogenase-4 component F